jgi:hypothetical protein
MLQYKVKFTTMNNACRLIVGWTTNYHHCFFSWSFIGAFKQIIGVPLYRKPQEAPLNS